MDRRAFIGTVAGSFLAVPLVVNAQQAGRVWRIGYLGNTPPMNPVIKQALVDLGYVEGKTAVFEARFADGRDDRYPALAAELARLKVDIIVTNSGSATEAAKAAAPTTPIVMAGISDPVGRGLVPSLARPGGNVTGIANLAIELTPKRIELLKAAVPNVTRIVILGNRGGWEPMKIDAIRKEQDAAAQTLGVTLRRVELNAPSEFDAATAAILREQPDALLLSPVPITFRLRKELAEFALAHRLPTIAWQRDQVLAGIMMSYGPSNDDIFREAAVYVDKILKGAKPADLPVEQPKKIELIINVKTAKALGLTIPQSLLLRADEVIQ
jgi:putative tryptophan/tyrosine transport system substrate-binding protein